MKHDFSDVVSDEFYTEDGHINLEALASREDHLCALSIAQRALAAIEEQLDSSVTKSDEWRLRANAAHRRWTWLTARIRERLSIFKSREKNVRLSRSILIRKHLVKELKKHVTPSVYKQCEKLARDLAREEAESHKDKYQ